MNFSILFLCGAVLSAAAQETVSQGYRSNFLGNGVDIPFPGFSETSDLAKDVLTKPENSNFDETGTWRQYTHHSIATNKNRRQPICVAMNIDTKSFRRVDRRGWRIDREIGADYQLDNDYYKGSTNLWDRGHMGRRAAAAWGATDTEAKAGSDDTMYYSNSCLQHMNLNQDEWLALEDWVIKDLGAEKVNVFTGPIYGSPGVPTRYIGSPPAEIPAGFFKVIFYLDANDEMNTQAFVHLQDAEALRDRNGRYRNNYAVYQVPTKAVEDATGLVFPTLLKTSNPITDETIELVPPPSNGNSDATMPLVGSPIVAPSVFIAAAFINPSGGSESGREWISLANYGPSDIDLTGWTLDDQASSRKPLVLDGKLVSGETLKLKTPGDGSGGSFILTNSGGSLELKDSGGATVSKVEWTRDATRDGEVTIFGFV